MHHNHIIIKPNNQNKMAQTSMTVRLDNQQKAIFDELCAQFGMSANTAINIFVKAVIRNRKIPFTISADSENDIREKALNVFSKLRTDAENSNDPEMTLDEINAEINEVRRLRKDRNNDICGN